MIAFEKAWIDQFVHLFHGHAEFLQETVHGFRDDFSVTGIPGSAFFPHVVELVTGSPVVIDKIM